MLDLGAAGLAQRAYHKPPGDACRVCQWPWLWLRLLASLICERRPARSCRNWASASCCPRDGERAANDNIDTLHHRRQASHPWNSPNRLFQCYRDQASNDNPDQPSAQVLSLPGACVIALVPGLHGEFCQAHTAHIECQHLHDKHPVIQRFWKQNASEQFCTRIQRGQDQHEMRCLVEEAQEPVSEGSHVGGVGKVVPEATF
jgi:hypothetical protein